MTAERGAGDDQEPLEREPGDGDVALDATAAVEHRRVRDRPDRAVDVVGADALEERAPHPARSTSILAKLDSSNSPAAERVARCSVTIAVDQCSPAQPRGRRCSWAGSSLLRYQLTRSHPLFSPNSAPSSWWRAYAGGVCSGRPGAALVVRVHDVVVRAVDLVGAGEAVAAAAVLRSEAADVHLPQVHRRLAADDPLGHHLADATGAGDAVGAEPGGDEEPGDLALAEDELTVGRERLRPVDRAGRRRRRRAPARPPGRPRRSARSDPSRDRGACC